MKKVFLPALASAILLASCSEVASGLLIDPSEMDSIEVVFSFNPYQMEPIVTKANVSIADLSKRLDVFIVEGANVTAIHQNKDTQAEGFGTVSATLNKTKTYTLYAVAHKGSGEASLANSILTFSDDKITDTFFYSTTFTPAETVNLSCLMHRIVGRFKLTMTDALPDNLAKVQFTVSGSGLGYHVSGYSTNVGDKTSIINNPSSANDGTTTFNIYILADSDEPSPVDVTVTALDADDAVIETKTFESVPIQAGYSTAYRGAFFITQAASMTFTAPDTWNNFDEETF